MSTYASILDGSPKNLFLVVSDRADMFDLNFVILFDVIINITIIIQCNCIIHPLSIYRGCILFVLLLFKFIMVFRKACAFILVVSFVFIPFIILIILCFSI